MKTLTIDLSDDVYTRAERRAAELGSSLHHQVASLLEDFGRVDEVTELVAARVRMKELFRTVRGFRMEPKIPREELYDRGSLR